MRTFLSKGSEVFVIKYALTKNVVRTTVRESRSWGEESYYVHGSPHSVKRRDIATTIEEARRAVIVKIERQMLLHEDKIDWHKAAIARLQRRLLAWKNSQEAELPIRTESK